MVSYPAVVHRLDPAAVAVAAVLKPGWPVPEEGDGAVTGSQLGLIASVEPGYPVLERTVVSVAAAAAAAVVVVVAAAAAAVEATNNFDLLTGQS